MDVLFLRNPDTGEVRRFFAKPAVPHDVASFEGWDVVDWSAWVNANADLPVVGAAIARHATQQPATEADAGDVDPYAPTDMTYTTPYDALAFHILNAKVAALPENTWRNDWTPAQTVNELVFEVGRLDHEALELQAKLAAAEARADAATRDCQRLSGEFNRGWDGATQSVLSLFESALDTALETEEAVVLKRLLAEFRAEYPKERK